MHSKLFYGMHFVLLGPPAAFLLNTFHYLTYKMVVLLALTLLLP